MRIYFFGLFFMMVVPSLFAQEKNLEEFNQYKYLSVETIIDKRRDIVDPWAISTYLRYKLIGLGYTVIDDRKESWTEEALFNQCLVLTCDILDRTKKIGRNRLELFFINCHGDTLLQTKGSGFEDTESKSYHAAIDKALETFEGVSYSFNPDLALGPLLPDVETGREDEAKLRAYYGSKEISAIEGIYSMAGKFNYRIGIKKVDGRFEGTILSSDAEYWNQYEIKIYLEPSMLGEDVFNITWLDDTKTTYETVGKLLEQDLVMELKKGDQRETIKLIKEYPLKEN